MLWFPTNRGLQFTAAREGCVLTVYPDSHNPAVGFGQNDPSLHVGETITMERACALLVAEAKSVCARLAKIFDGADGLLRQHVDAIFSLAYNCGTGTIRDDHAFIEGVKAFASNPAPMHDLFVLVHPAGHPAPFNLSRRLMEADLFLNGNYGNISRLMFWPEGKSPRNSPPDKAQIITMPTFLKAV